jgi:glycosyltransferase involved in cell wall biosynthesis
LHICIPHIQGENVMRIALVSWAPFHAGAEVAAERLAVGLRDAGHEVVIVLGTRGETFDRMRAAGLRCEFVPMVLTDKWRWWRFAGARRKLIKILRREQPDVVHCNDLPTSQMVGAAAKRLGIPRLCHHRWIFEGEAIDWLNKFGAERHLFVSNALMSDLCSKSSRLARSERAVVYDGLPLPSEPTHEYQQAATHDLGLAIERKLVLFAGQIIERKGVADLIEAWAGLRDRWHQNADLVIVGDDLEGNGAYRRKMEDLAHQRGCPARFVGFQRNVGQWLTAADLVLVPSHAEPLGNATLEAMAHARAVIGCNVGGIPEMIVNGVTGALVPPRSPGVLGAAIDRLLVNDPQREQMGKAARLRCQEMFSIEAHTRAVLRHYEEVLANRVAAAGA